MSYYVICDNGHLEYFDYFEDAFNFAFNNHGNVYNSSGFQLTEWE